MHTTTESSVGVERGAARRIGAVGSSSKDGAAAGHAGAHHLVVRGGWEQHRCRWPSRRVASDRGPLALAFHPKRCRRAAGRASPRCAAHDQRRRRGEGGDADGRHALEYPGLWRSESASAAAASRGLGAPSACALTAARASNFQGTLDRSFGEVQQDLLLSSLTIG